MYHCRVRILCPVLFLYNNLYETNKQMFNKWKWLKNQKVWRHSRVALSSSGDKVFFPSSRGIVLKKKPREKKTGKLIERSLRWGWWMNLCFRFLQTHLPVAGELGAVVSHLVWKREKKKHTRWLKRRLRAHSQIIKKKKISWTFDSDADFEQSLAEIAEINVQGNNFKA